MQPLRGTTVVSLEQAIAAPYATRQLADLGARVIKVERPGGGDFARGYDQRVAGLSSHFVWVNRSKESLTLDVKDPRGRDVLVRLLATADVFVQNLAPGAAARMGLGATDLRARHPRLIVCDISGYGHGGPYESTKAYDLMVQGEAGLVSVTGTAEEVAKVGISVSDIAAGMYAYSGVLAALLERGVTGKGSVVDVSMLEATVEWMGFPLYYAYDGAPPPPRAGAAHATIYPYGPFEAADGRVVMMAVQNEREWRVFCERFLGRPELAEHPDYAGNARRNAHRDVLGPVIAARFAELTGAEAAALLAAVPVAHANVNTVADVWAHPQLAARALARGADPGRPGPGARPARPGRPRAADGPGAGPRRAHPPDPRRAGVHRGRRRGARGGGRRVMRRTSAEQWDRLTHLPTAGGALAYRLAEPDTPARIQRPVVLVHGGSSSSRTWARLAADLQDEGRRAIVPDLRGHGSSFRSDDYTTAAFTSDVVELLDGLALPAVDLVGHSLGAFVAIAVARRQPDRVNRLVLEEPPAPPPTARRGGPSSVSTAVRGLLGAGLRRDCDYRALRAVLDELRRASPNWWRGLQTIRCPTLVVVGRRSSHADAADLDLLITRLAARLVTIDAGHRVHSRAHDEFRREVLPFLLS